MIFSWIVILLLAGAVSSQSADASLCNILLGKSLILREGELIKQRHHLLGKSDEVLGTGITQITEDKRFAMRKQQLLTVESHSLKEVWNAKAVSLTVNPDLFYQHGAVFLFVPHGALSKGPELQYVGVPDADAVSLLALSEIVMKGKKFRIDQVTKNQFVPRLTPLD